MKFLFLAFLITPALAIDYPGPPPGVATVQAEASGHVLANAVISARFVPQGASLKLASVTRNGGAVFSGESDLFRIDFTGGGSLASSAMSLAAPPRMVTLSPVANAARAAERLPGKALQADFKSPDGALQVQWQAELRDGAGYLHQSLEVSALKGSHAVKEITGLIGKMDGALVSGYTDGSVATGNSLFAGLETPLAKLSFDASAAVTIGNWTPALVSPKRMTFPVTFPSAGPWEIKFQYTSGNHRLEVNRVELLTGSQVVSADAHFGYAGVPSSNNTYTLQVPAAGSYTLGIDNTYPASDTNSNGTITASSLGNRTLRASWPRNLTLAPGTVWKIGSVIGVHEPGQLRRAFLHYLERERAHPYRHFVHYNSWYDLNIGRNDRSDPLQRMTEAQTMAVVDAWNQQLYTQRGVRLDGFIWDDGWDDFDSLWDFHVGFPNSFAEVNRRAKKQQAGTGAWLSPWGGYGGSKSQRVAFWNSTHDPDIGEFHLSNAEYYDAFRGRCQQMLADYDMRYFKFDGIGAGTFATGPASGNDADIDGLLRLQRDLRQTRPDVFINSTVGTWASPFWLLTSDSIWRQGEDVSFAGTGNNRERWITYHDNMVYDRFAANAPLFPLNSLMFHGLVIGNYPGTAPAQMPLDLQSVKNEIRCAMGCGSGLQEFYVTHGLMTAAMWDELAKGIRWLRANADTLADIHWVGGDPDGGGTQTPYGWAAWSPRKGTLTLRNPNAAVRNISLTLADALQLPVGAAAAFNVRSAYEDQRELAGISGASVAANATLTFALQPYEVLVFDLWPHGVEIPSKP